MAMTGAGETLAIRAHSPGPPSVLVAEHLPLPPPGSGEVRVAHTAVGVNFTDVYHRSGAYPAPMPLTLGFEAAGVVTMVGGAVSELRPGDRVAYVWKTPGAYAKERNVPAERLVVIPNALPDEIAAGSLLKGLTVEYLLRRTFRARAGHTMVVTAAAGGVGSLLCQWARHLGCRVIGVVSSDQKAEVALHAGADHALVLDGTRDLSRQVRELVPAGVDVVYDSVGQAIFPGCLDMLKRRGLLVMFGQTSGPVPAIDPALLWAKGSLFVTRPSLFDYVADPQEYRVACSALFALLTQASVSVDVTGRYRLEDAARAHTDLEARRTTGSLVLVP